MIIQKARIQKVRSIIKESKAEYFFITNPYHIFYLTGFRGLSPEEREATLLVSDFSVSLFVPRMYAEQAHLLDTVQQNIVTCVVDHERDGLMIKWLKTLGKGIKVLIEEGDLTIEEYTYLSKLLDGTFQSSNRRLEGLRIRKDTDELAKMVSVVSKTDIVFNNLVKMLKQSDYTHFTELDIADSLRVLGRKEGLLEFSFDPIVASGAGGSEPHYRTSNKKLYKGDVLLMDFGFTLDGYHSDVTRTIVLGKASNRVRNMYDLVLACNEYSLKQTKPGVNAGDLHRMAVDFFAKQNLEENFIHGLGHGIGLEVHEEPFFRLERKTILEPGMAVTIEPGLYFPNEFGIRIEDYVVITDTGHKVLSKNSPKQLIEVS